MVTSQLRSSREFGHISPTPIIIIPIESIICSFSGNAKERGSSFGRPSTPDRSKKNQSISNRSPEAPCWLQNATLRRPPPPAADQVNCRSQLQQRVVFRRRIG